MQTSNIDLRAGLDNAYSRLYVWQERIERDRLMRGLMRTVLWTELLTALREDYPNVVFSDKAGTEVSKVIRANTDCIFELSENAGNDEGGCHDT